MPHGVLPSPFDELLARARDGDERAFEAIYREVQPRVSRFLQVHSPDHAEDAAADAWLEVARAIRRFEGDEVSFRAWVFTIARRKVIDAVRREARRPVVALPDDGTSQEPTGAPDETADHALHAEETRQSIALVRTLPPDQAEVVMLRVVGGLDNAEIAELVGKSSGAVRVLAHRGLKRLARTLQAREEQGQGVSSSSASRPGEGV